MKKQNKIKKLDKFFYHEAMDRMYLVANIVNDALVEHPVIMKHKSLRKKVAKAHELLLQAYQEIGSLRFKSK